MCQTALEALLRRPYLASSSSGNVRRSLKAPDCSASRFLPSIKGVDRYQKLVCKSSSQNYLCSQQAVTLLPKHEVYSGVESSEGEQQSSSPDFWMQNCVCDIVRNINQAPFLHMLFEARDSSSGIRSQRQRVVDVNHCSVDEKWRKVKDSVRNAAPDGVILVHQLDDNAVEGCCVRDGLSSNFKKHDIETNRKKCTDLWGVLVLGREAAKSACYILKTTSVTSSSGTCTQFCLTKAKCFGPSWQSQAQSCWLLNIENNNQVS